MTGITFKSSRRKILVLLLLTASIAFLHFLLPTESYVYHRFHIVLRKLYYLPPVVAAAWFGLRGALAATALVSCLFGVHIFFEWPGNHLEQANLMGEFASFWAVGAIAGALFDRQRTLLAELAHANEETLVSLVSALDMREHSTRMHSQRVREYTRLLTSQFGLADDEVRDIGFGALLHDVGKIAVPDHVLMKRDSLSPEEWAEMRKHPEAGYGMVKGIGFLKGAAELVYAHHECWDGSGYPRGLRGDEIPLGARLFIVADVFDALTSDRPYHQAVGYQEAADYIRQKSGTHFDPAAVEAFLAVGQEEFDDVRARYNSAGAAPASG